MSPESTAFALGLLVALFGIVCVLAFMTWLGYGSPPQSL